MIAVNFANNLLNIQSELFNMAYNLTSDRNSANDLLQETSLKVLMNQEKYQGQTNFRGWVFTIMKNIFINDFNRAARNRTYVDQTENLYFLNTGVDAEGDSADESCTLNDIQRMVNALPKDSREIFNLFLAGYRYREIAERLQIPLGTVKSNIFITRQHLQKQLKDVR